MASPEDFTNDLSVEKSLEQLANELFSLPPGNTGRGNPAHTEFTPPNLKNPLNEKTKGAEFSHLQYGNPDPNFPEKNNAPASLNPAPQHAAALPIGGVSQVPEAHNPLIHSNNSASQYPYTYAGAGTSPAGIPNAAGNNLNIQSKDVHNPFGEAYLPQYSSDSTLRNLQPALFEQDSTFLHPDLLELLKNSNTAPKLKGISHGFTNETAKSPFYFLTENPFVTPFSGERPSNIVAGNPRPPLDVNLIRKDFPILRETVNGRPLIWMDNAATTQKPSQVIERIKYFYEHENSNIHRAAHELAARATDAYEEARKKVQAFLNAGSVNEIVFVRGTTEAINLVAKSWGDQYLKEGDEIILSHLEHHANIVPWKQLATKKGIKIRVIPVDEDGQVILEEYAKLLNPKTKLVAFTHVSNALGTVTPAKTIIEMAHHAGAKVLLDGAQSVSHMRVDVRELNCDWLVFSGHKIFGPTGIGVLYGKEALLNETQPWQGGGNMIVDVTFEEIQYHKAPGRFEAGTGNIADAVGLGAAIDYVTKLGMENIYLYEHFLLQYATRLIKDVPGLRLIGTAHDKASVLSFVLEGFKTEEVGAALNAEGIAVRSGHHCAQPILRRFGVEASVRPSLAFYNTCAEVDTLVSTLYRLAGSRTHHFKVG